MHSVDDHRGLQQIAAVLREHLGARRRSYLVAGPADPLQSPGDGGGRFDQQHQIDCTHVDAQFER